MLRESDFQPGGLGARGNSQKKDRINSDVSGQFFVARVGSGQPSMV